MKSINLWRLLKSALLATSLLVHCAIANSLEMSFNASQPCKGQLARELEQKEVLPYLKVIDWEGMTAAYYRTDTPKIFLDGNMAKTEPIWLDIDGDGRCDAIFFDWLPPVQGNQVWRPSAFYFLSHEKSFRQISVAEYSRRGIIPVWIKGRPQPYLVFTYASIGLALWVPSLDAAVVAQKVRLSSGEVACEPIISRFLADQQPPAMPKSTAVPASMKFQICSEYDEVIRFAKPKMPHLSEDWQGFPKPPEDE